MYQSYPPFYTPEWQPSVSSAHRFVVKMITVLLICSGGSFNAATAEALIVHSLSEIESGTLLLPSGSNSYYMRAPLVDTAVVIGVQGLLARTVVEQTFSNHSSEWVEGVYAFPLTDDASVDELTMIVGDTEIKGEIKTRSAAKQTYQRAKKSGKKASLLEQQRPNLFTTRIANIPPGESIVVRIAYQSSIRYSDGEFSLGFPLTITPRYIPGTIPSYNSATLADSLNTGWATPAAMSQDAAAVTPPMTNIASPVSLAVTLDTGLNNVTIASSTHDIITAADQANQTLWNVTLADKTIPADRDFKLAWSAPVSQAPVAAVFRQDKKTTSGVESFASIMLMPPQDIFSDAIPAREVIFVIDTSGSMNGNSIKQARETLALGIERLSPADTFNVIEFDDNAHKLFSQSVPADDQNKQQAIRWVSRLAADGGTEILGAMATALQSMAAEKTDRIRQIVFVTDGSVGNENQIFSYLQKHIGSNRLFTVGIGSAPNTWFMRKSAELGRGTYTSIANNSELSDKVLRLLKKLERPAITDVSISFNTAQTPEVFPVTMPDIYMGEPVIADARWNNTLGGGDIEINGRYAGQTWTQTIKLGALANPPPVTKDNNQTQGLDKLWATRKIQSLEDSLLFNANYEEVERAVTDIALAYSMVTKYTSLVAVEEKISRNPATTDLHTAAIPLAMPAGNTMHFPQGSLGTTLRFLLSLVLTIITLLIVLRKRQQADTSEVCTVLPTGKSTCKNT